MKIFVPPKIQRLALLVLLITGVSLLLQVQVQAPTVPAFQPTSYDPASYGLPDKIAGYDVLAAVPTNFHQCAEIDSITIVVQVSEATMYEYLQSSSTHTNIFEAVKALDPSNKLIISVVGSGTTREKIWAEYAALEKSMRETQVGCPISGLLLLLSGTMTLTPSAETVMASSTPD
jgi:hypothetical protein